MRGIEERGKAPISAFNPIERDIRDNSLIGPAAGVEGPGESSCSIVEQTRSEPQDQAFPPLRILDLPLDVLVDIAERLSPMDLLRMPHTNQELRVAAMIVATPQERRIQVQAICGALATGLQQRLVVVGRGAS
ncbi:F-box protein [Mesorhizobium australicum]|uniref:F-box protein n=1 Tax=Mesorhizobium australicum TaxID=536018 RepID=UPI00333824C4